MCAEPEFFDECNCTCDADFINGVPLDEQCDGINDNDILGLLWQQKQLNFAPGEDDLVQATRTFSRISIPAILVACVTGIIQLVGGFITAGIAMGVLFWLNWKLTAITIRERAVDRAIELKREGIGPDRILMMVSTSASHMKKNSGLDHAGYWAEAERAIRKAHDAGIRVNGTVSTIWGCPIEGPTRLEDAVTFTKRFLDIGADDIEHADHDGSAPPCSAPTTGSSRPRA